MTTPTPNERLTEAQVNEILTSPGVSCTILVLKDGTEVSLGAVVAEIKALRKELAMERTLSSHHLPPTGKPIEGSTGKEG